MKVTITLEEDYGSKSRVYEAYRITSIVRLNTTDKYQVHYDKYPFGEHYFFETKWGIDYHRIKVGDYLLLDSNEEKFLTISKETFSAFILGGTKIVDGGNNEE